LVLLLYTDIVAFAYVSGYNFNKRAYLLIAAASCRSWGTSTWRQHLF